MKFNIIQTKSIVEDIDEAKGIVKIRVSTFGNLDSHNEIIDAKAFTRSVNHFNDGGRTRIKHLKNHNVTQAIGKPLELILSSDGLDIVSKINLDKQIGKDTFSDYKFYAEDQQTLEHSVGYIPKIKQKSKESNAVIVKEAQLLEYSTLDFLGSNPVTGLLGLKNINMNEEELIKRIELLESKLSALDSLNSTQPVEVEEESEADVKENLLLTYLKRKHGE